MRLNQAASKGMGRGIRLSFSRRSLARASALTGTTFATLGSADAHAQVPAHGPSPQTITADSFVDVRCARDGSTTYFEGRGTVYAQEPNAPQRPLFHYLGLDVSRCVRNAQGGWTLVSRELGYYLDPATGRPMHTWKTPGTGEVVPVVHIANELLQLNLPHALPVRMQGPLSTVTLEMPIAHPVPFDDPRFAPYFPAPQAVIFGSYSFVFSGGSADAKAPRDVGLTYFEIGPHRPWMKMGDAPGQLVFSIASRKVANFAELDPLLRAEIEERLPLFKEAPTCKTTLPNGNSFVSFVRDFDAYLAGARFPLPAPLRSEPCEAKP